MSPVVPLLAAASALIWVVPNVLRWRSASKAMRESNVSIYHDIGRATSESALAELMELNPTHPAPALHWARWPTEAGNHAETLRRAELIRAKFPRNPDAHMAVVSALMWLHRMDEAEALARETQKKFPGADAPTFGLADIASHRGNWPEVARIWDEVRRRQPLVTSGYFRGAAVALKLDDPGRADRIIEQGLAVLPPDKAAELLLPYAQAAHDRRDWTEAARRWALLRAARDLEPLGYLRGAEALAQLGQTREAEELHAKAAFLFPRHPELAPAEAAATPAA